jgi:protein tyrosine phosphatase (PTP) superfamily phosphohydrolase (DUF442 family)
MSGNTAVLPNAPRLVKFTDDLGFSVQPNITELESLGKAGFKSVINMREEEEEGKYTVDQLQIFV